MLIDARCLTIDQGNPLRRLVIGFGSGASRFETFVGVYGGPERRKLLEFTTLADSGSLPGAWFERFFNAAGGLAYRQNYRPPVMRVCASRYCCSRYNPSA